MSLVLYFLWVDPMLHRVFWLPKCSTSKGPAGSSQHILIAAQVCFWGFFTSLGPLPIVQSHLQKLHLPRKCRVHWMRHSQMMYFSSQAAGICTWVPWCVEGCVQVCRWTSSSPPAPSVALQQIIVQCGSPFSNIMHSVPLPKLIIGWHFILYNLLAEFSFLKCLFFPFLLILVLIWTHHPVGWPLLTEIKCGLQRTGETWIAY